MVNVDGRRALLSITYNSNFILLLEFPAELEDENEAPNISSTGPVIRIKRRDAHIDEQFQLIMQELGTKIRDSRLDLEVNIEHLFWLALQLSSLGLDFFAHEVSTMRTD